MKIIQAICVDRTELGKIARLILIVKLSTRRKYELLEDDVLGSEQETVVLNFYYLNENIFHTFEL